MHKIKAKSLAAMSIYICTEIDYNADSAQQNKGGIYYERII